MTQLFYIVANGQSHHFDGLLIATGSRPIIPSILGIWKQWLMDKPLQFMDAHVAVLAVMLKLTYNRAAGLYERAAARSL